MSAVGALQRIANVFRDLRKTADGKAAPSAVSPKPATTVSPVEHDVRKMDEARKKARAGFSERGESLTAWSVSRGFNPNLVHAVLDGRLPCHRGQAHKIAVELGLKPKAMAA